MTRTQPFLALLFSLLIALPVAAQQSEVNPPATPTSKTFGADTVHFNVLSTTFLSPQVARSYGIVRGDNKFLVNVSVQHRSGTDIRAIRAKVSGSSSDLIHVTPLQFREIIEQDAIYYIAELEVDGKRERRDFRLRVNTDTRAQPYDIQFVKTLYAED
ncbi:DUF4426 domain-containing protein [Spongiibacter sp.]|uniref:DUF4426 domain-containing protein n=1 Tax=Spongiibacter sp. TaxID=2024860 RepID=UPI0035630493